MGMRNACTFFFVGTSEGKRLFGIPGCSASIKYMLNTFVTSLFVFDSFISGYRRFGGTYCVYVRVVVIQKISMNLYCNENPSYFLSNFHNLIIYVNFLI